MPAIQTSYAERIAIGYAGQPADETTWSADSRHVETAAGIPFGCAVSKGTGDKGVVLGGAVAGFVGVALRDAAAGGPDDEYAENDTAAILFRGDVFVKVKNDVAAHGAVYYDSTTGLWDDAASGNVGPVPGATWITSASQNGLAVLRLAGSQDAH